MTPGATRSIWRDFVLLIGPLPSTGSPSEETTLPSIASPTGTSAMRFVLLTTSPSLTSVSEDNADAVLVKIERDTLNAALKLKQLIAHYAVQPVNAGDTVTDLDDASRFAYVQL
jgi:hypothetical protein